MHKKVSKRPIFGTAYGVVISQWCTALNLDDQPSCKLNPVKFSLFMVMTPCATIIYVVILISAVNVSVVDPCYQDAT